jgi:hypothetical protein
MKKQKISCLILLGAALAWLGLSSCQKGSEGSSSSSLSSAALSISLNQTSLALTVGDSATLTATVTGSNAAVSWISKNSAIATIEAGVVKAVGEGRTIVKAIVENVEALCEVNVSAKGAEKLVSINLDEDSYSLYETLTAQVTANVLYGDDPVSATLTYTMANPAVATIDANGLITGVKAGETTLSVVATYEGKTDTISVPVSVLTLAPEIAAKFTTRDVNIGTPLPLSFELTYGGKILSGDFAFTYSFVAGHTGEAEVKEGSLYGLKAGTVELLVTSSYNGKDVKASFLFTIHQLCDVNFLSEGVSVKSFSIMDGSLLTSSDLPADPILEGYLFRNWVDSEGAVLDLATPVPGNITYYASWYRLGESSLGGALKKDYHLFSDTDGTVNVSGTNAAFNGFKDGGGSLNAPTGKSSYSFTLPAINLSAALSKGGEVSFDLSSTGWTSFSFAGIAIPYDNEHGASDPYHLSIKANGLGYGLYASSTNEGLYGEIATVPNEVVSGTAGLTLSCMSDLDSRVIAFSKLSVYAYDYQSALSKELAALTTTQSAANLSAYLSEVATNLTPYEKDHYSEPAVVTAAKTALAGQANAAFAFPTPSFTDTTSMRTQAAGFGLANDMHWAEAASGDTTDGSYFYGWQFQTEAGATSAFIELPRIAYSIYSSVTFKTWLGAKGSFAVNGTQLEAASDSANQDWGYVCTIVTDASGSKMTIYHGNGSKGAMTQVQATYTLPSDVANGLAPLHFIEATSTAWTINTIWGITGVKGTI